MPFLRRFLGILFSPKATYRDIAATPRAAAVLALVAVVVAGSLFAFLSTEIGQEAYVDSRIRSVEAFGGEVSDAQYLDLKTASQSASLRLGLAALVGVPAGAVALATLLVIVSGNGPAKATLPQAVAVVAHSGLVLAVWRVVSWPLDYGRQTMTGSTSLGAFASFVDDTSPIARLLGTIDLFVAWWLISLGIGVAVLLQRRARPVVLAFLSAYAAIALALTAVTAAFGAS